MKKKLLAVFFIVAMVIACMFALGGCNNAGSVNTANDVLRYMLNEDEKSYYVSGVAGSPKEVSIAKEYNGLPVTDIGERAFFYCRGLTKIIIPDSVTRIGDSAFESCYELTNIEIPDSVISIGDYAFAGCGTLRNLIIPDSVNSIGEGTFNSCESLQFNEYDNALYLGSLTNKYAILVRIKEWIDSCTINENTKIICGGAFEEGHPISITIPDNVNSIGKMSFYYGSNRLHSISVSVNNKKYHSAGNCIIETDSKTLILGCSNSQIPSDGSVAIIDRYAFSGCDCLYDIDIPNSVKEIKNVAFENCALTNLTIPDNVTKIGSQAFHRCSGLTNLIVTEGNTKYHSVGNCIIETDSKTLILGCLNSQIPSDGSVASIGNFAFADCKSLTSVSIPNSVTSIGICAFDGCRSLTSITIPDSVTSIGKYAFQGCSELTNLSILNDKPNIEIDAFSSCYIETATIPATAIKLVLNKHLEKITVTCGAISDEPFYFDCDALKYVVIGDKVTKIEGKAFYGCSGLESLTVTEGNEKYHSIDNCIIGTDSKALILGCSNSQIPSDGSVTSIGDYAFCKSRALTSVSIPYGVTSIGVGAFAGCEGLATLAIPSSVTSIGDYAFEGCSSIENVFISNSVATIGEGAFKDCSGLTYIDLPFNLTSIGKSSFEGCSNLTSIIVPDNVTSIGDRAFFGCRELKSIVIGNSMENIKSYAFSGVGHSYESIITVNVYYRGTEKEWEKITIDEWALANFNCKIFYYLETEPALNSEGTDYIGNYWRYVDGKPAAWTKNS